MESSSKWGISAIASPTVILFIISVIKCLARPADCLAYNFDLLVDFLRPYQPANGFFSGQTRVTPFYRLPIDCSFLRCFACRLNRRLFVSPQHLKTRCRERNNVVVNRLPISPSVFGNDVIASHRCSPPSAGAHQFTLDMVFERERLAPFVFCAIANQRDMPAEVGCPHQSQRLFELRHIQRVAVENALAM